jgi:multidrug efflux pump subunit AcrA (membrane-fusion protein)
MASKNYENAKSNYKLAKIGLDKNQNDFDKGIVKAKKSGIISDILIEEGEITDAGIPVIILRDSTYVVNIGVSKEDLKNINLGDFADVIIDEVCGEGIVSEIDELPDATTGLYLVKIQIEDGDYIIGKTGEVTFNIDEKRGVKVPLSAIGTEDYDYVFLKKDNRAFKQKIEIVGIYKDFILIDGINESEKIVIEGMRALNDGDYIRTLE